MWIDPKRKSSFQFIITLIDILQNEIPKLMMFKQLFIDLHTDLFEIGFPIKLEFNVKKNIWVTMNVKSVE